MDICLGFDDQYAPHSQALMESILQESADISELQFWFACPRTPADDVARKIAAQLSGRARWEFLPPTPQVLRFPVSQNEFAQHISHAMYLRLVAPTVVPDSVERLVYLDSDMLCTSSLAQLSTLDLNGQVIGAVRDIYTRRFSDQGYLPGLLSYPQLSGSLEYFNSGMLVIDVARWRQERVTEDCFRYIRRHADNLRFPDQDALNYVLAGKWLRLPHQWNHLMSWRLEPELGGRLGDASLITFLALRNFGPQASHRPVSAPCATGNTAGQPRQPARGILDERPEPDALRVHHAENWCRCALLARPLSGRGQRPALCTSRQYQPAHPSRALRLMVG